ncbi:MAG TPA: flagellar biosynthesis anti-sigma factor FlgM [bacterium]|nr:flagellar biosynthesis anti-sigma factor FlgM [bacterium]
MIQSIDAVSAAGMVASRVYMNLPAATTGNSRAGVNDQVAISAQGRACQTARDKAGEVTENEQIREALVQAMKEQLEKNPFPAGKVADLIADKIINGWGRIGIS